MKFLLNVFLIFLLQPAFAKRCEILFSDKKAPYKSDAVADYYRLGTGFEGIVTLVQPKDGSPAYVRKKFTLTPDITVPNAIRGLSFLEKLFRENNVPIRSATVLRREGPELVLKYVRGKTLEEAIRDPNLPADIKKLLEKTYADALMAAENALRQAPNLIEIKHEKGKTALEDRLFVQLKDPFLPDKKLFIYLKADNILVDPDQEKLVLIDPS